MRVGAAAAAKWPPRLNSHPHWLVEEVATVVTRCNGKELLLRVWQGGLRSSMVHDSIVRISEDIIDDSVNKVASIRYNYWSMPRHRPQWRRKKWRVWTWNFSLGFYSFGPDAMDCIDHYHPWARRRLDNHQQVVLRAQCFTWILTIVITVPCCCGAGWDGVVVEAICRWGRLGL